MKFTTGSKGARSRSSVDPAFLMALETGTVQSRTHVEQMSMSMSRLMSRTFPLADLAGVDGLPFISRLREAGSRVGQAYREDLHSADSCWISDTVRGWLAMSVAADNQRQISVLVARLRPFARDHHFAVREWAWLALRPRVVDDPIGALEALLPLASSQHPFERRFALEATRPRSVWGKHIELFKVEPERGAELLEATRCDPDAYVRTAVANWLNDVARSRPDFVRSRVDQWAACCPSTDAVLRRATRSLEPSAEA
jgi:3-methyladenine DNA glycosylase AlkC